MSTTNVADANMTQAPSTKSGTVDLSDLDAPRTRVATIDLSAFGAPLALAPSRTDGELFCLAMGSRSIHVITASHLAVSSLVDGDGGDGAYGDGGAG